MYVKNPYARTLKREDQIVLCNTKTGAFVRTKIKYAEILDHCMSTESQSIMCDNTELLKTLKYLFTELCKIEYYIQQDKYNEVYHMKMDIVYLSITNRCNLKCKHCVAASYGTVGEDPMNTAEWKKIIDQLAAVNPGQITFSGGEPLLRKDALELMRYAKERTKCPVVLSTNGLLINHDNVKELVKISDTIAISLDGYDEASCEKIRGAGVYRKVIDSIKRIQETGYTKISLSMLESSYTEDHISEFYELCDKLKVKPIVRIFSPTGRGKDNRDELLPNQQHENEEELACYCKLCWPGRRELDIAADGNVFPCAPLAGIPELCMGNIRDLSLAEIIDPRKADLLIDYLRPWNMDECSKCDVNLFCHSCINYILGIKQDESHYKKICRKRKKQLEKLVWEVE
ncbi:radical SAM protein [Lachnospiraceae bacterium DSM 108991]|uniref:Radical SAM protein n=1 Tax=Claveliimonas monacensis TaxID=2779351 RepID=A0ABR9RM37_9FIRM|nr:radical SAM protein [Claveliimonas monacensis]MBE5064042.1 radical SAM protein [Claveliimonas monacensis]